jgi:hypothetical protein
MPFIDKRHTEIKRQRIYRVNKEVKNGHTAAIPYSGSCIRGFCLLDMLAVNRGERVLSTESSGRANGRDDFFGHTTAFCDMLQRHPEIRSVLLVY